jgi:hypothetical protein
MTALLSERIQYDFANVSPDDLHDAALDIEEWRQLADTPDDITATISEIEEWKDIVPFEITGEVRNIYNI